MRPERIILVTSDHMRADAIGAAGNTEVVTPNLDALARGGVRFNRCFCQNPVCMPSRASFMTGFYPPQVGVTRNGIELPDGAVPTVADHLSGLGYQGTHIGKLHLQNHEDHDLDDRPSGRFGFGTMMRSEARGCYFDAWMKWLVAHHPSEAPAFSLPRATERTRGELEVRGKTVAAPWQHSHAGWVADTAARFLTGTFVHREAPQFLHLGFHHPHPPLNPTADAFAPYAERALSVPARHESEADDKPEPLAGMLRDKSEWTDEQFIEYKRYFYALVTEMDRAIGHLVSELSTAGMLEDTLIVFTSDHGDMCGNHGMTHKGPSFFDEIMNVPLLCHWPRGLADAGRIVDGLVELVDLLPTLLGFAGGYPSGLLPGIDHSGALRSGEPITGRDSVFAFADPGMAMVRTETRKYIRYRRTGGEVLYDYADGSPPERHNAACEPTKAGELSAMRELLLDRTIDACRSARFRDKCF